MSISAKIVLTSIALKDLREKVDSARGSFVKVGILGANAAREGSDLNNPTIGLIHEKGSFTHNPPIPRRSFLEDPLVSKLPDRINELGPAVWREALISRGAIGTLDVLGVVGENIVQEGFETGGFGEWPKLSPRTIARKGSSAILIDTAKLRQSVTSEVVTAK